jgi:hypothetical protein
MKRTRQQVRDVKKERLRKKAIIKAMHRSRHAVERVPVNTERLKPDNSYDTPEFAKRGYYLDQPFQCQDCGVQEVWTARQQRWWYEIAQGGVWTTANRCRSCRRKERERKAAARKVHLEGLAKKQRGP